MAQSFMEPSFPITIRKSLKQRSLQIDRLKLRTYTKDNNWDKKIPVGSENM